MVNQKFTAMLHYIISKCGSKPNVGKTVLYKLCYFSDFDYYEKYEKHLTGAKYVRIEHGPAPKYETFSDAVKKLEADGAISVKEKQYYGKPQVNYKSLRTPDVSCFTKNQLDVIDSVINRLSGMSAKEISEYSHEDNPWRIANPGEELDYEAVFYRSPRTSVREYDDD